MRFSEVTLCFLLCAGTVFGQSRQQLDETAAAIYGSGAALRGISIELTDADIAALRDANGSSHAWEKVDVYEVERGKTPMGVMMVDNVKGKARPITYAVAFDTAGSIRALEILAYRESHGGEVRSEAFRRQFEGKKAGDALAVGRDIRNISGATISSRSVTRGAHALATLHAYLRTQGRLK